MESKDFTEEIKTFLEQYKQKNMFIQVSMLNTEVFLIKDIKDDIDEYKK